MTDNIGKMTMCNNDESKEIRIYACCNEYGHRKCEYINEKVIKDLLQPL